MSRAFWLGTFVIGALLILGLGIFWIGNQQFRFSHTYRLSAEFQNVAGLAGGAEVRVGGKREGSVVNIQLPKRPDGRIRVTMNLEAATRDVIKKDSQASISSEGLVGDEFVDITFGALGAPPPVKDGDTIGAQPVVQIGDLINKANRILDTTQGALQNVQDTANNLDSITTKVNRGAGSLGALLNNQGVYQHVDAASAELQEDMEALKHNFLLRGFFRKRGYEDATELQKYAIAQLPAKPFGKRFVIDASKIFAKPGSAKLKNQKLLNDAGKFLEDNPFNLAVVTAHTGMQGDTDKDRVLTEAQAMVVREYISQHFKLDDTKLKTLGLSKSSAPQDIGRIEILVYSS